MSPHGVYPASGDDRWVAVACETDAQWRTLARLIDRVDLASLDLGARLTRRGELDEAVTAWTRAQDVTGIESLLQAAGVSAHRIAYAEDILGDPQLAHRCHWQRVSHPEHGETWVEGPAIQLSRTPGAPRWAGPTYGQHLFEVLSELLEYDPDMIAELVASGVCE